MRIFQVEPDRDRWPGPYDIDGKHTWGLPGVTCPSCRATWASVGTIYPSVDLSALPNEQRFRTPPWKNARPVPLEVLNELRRPILPLMPDGSVPPPGAAFGPFEGRGKGIPSHLAWPVPWIMLVRREASEPLIRAGIRLSALVPSAIRFDRKDVPELLEVEAHPIARLAAPSLPADGAPPCEGCGRRAISMPNRFVLERSSVPRDLDLFRGKEPTTYFFATERFAEAVLNLNLIGAQFREVSLAD